MRGRALQRAREELFARNRWCVHCDAEGRQTRATIRNHVIPLAEGGTDDVENTQGLCLDCWEAKKEAEAQRGLPTPLIRQDFKKSAVPRNARGHFTERRAGRAAHRDPPMAGRPDAVLARRAAAPTRTRKPVA